MRAYVQMSCETAASASRVLRQAVSGAGGQRSIHTHNVLYATLSYWFYSLFIFGLVFVTFWFLSFTQSDESGDGSGNREEVNTFDSVLICIIVNSRHCKYIYYFMVSVIRLKVFDDDLYEDMYPPVRYNLTNDSFKLFHFVVWSLVRASTHFPAKPNH